MQQLFEELVKSENHANAKNFRQKIFYWMLMLEGRIITIRNNF